MLASGADVRLPLQPGWEYATLALAGSVDVDGVTLAPGPLLYLGSGRSDLFQAGAFIRHNIGPAYLSGVLAYGWQDINTDRTVTVAGVDRLRAKFNANAWSGRVEGGYRFVAQGFGWTPYAAGQFTTFELPNYAEQAIVGVGNAGALVRQHEGAGAVSRLGVAGRKAALPDGRRLLIARQAA